MVATQFAAGRAVAAATIAILLAGIVPTPTAQAQTVADVFITPGEAKIYQSTYVGAGGPVATSFIADGTSEITIEVPVQQTGSSSQLTNVPLYWVLHGQDGGAIDSACRVVNIPGQSGADPGRVVVPLQIPVAGLENDFGYNVTLEVLSKPASATRDCPTTAAKACGAAAITGNCIAEPPAGGRDNMANAYFVKGAFLDLVVDEIRWCERSPDDALAATCSTDMMNGGQHWNVTVQGETDRFTFFEVVVRNRGTWGNLSNYGGPTQSAGDGWEFQLNVSVNGTNILGRLNLTDTDNTTTTSRYFEDGDGAGVLARSRAWNLNNMAGTYNVSVRIDVAPAIRPMPGDTTPNTGFRDVVVMYRDFVVEFRRSDFKTEPADPYPYNGAFRVVGNVTLRNAGPAPIIPAGDVGQVRFLWYLDNLTNSIFNETHDFSPDENGAQTFQIDIPLTSSGTSPRYIPPGKHTLHVVIDRPVRDGADNVLLADTHVESNESNNTASIDIFVRDTTVPVFLDPIRLIDGAVSSRVSTPSLTEVYPHDPVKFVANISDDDGGLTVVANLTLDADPSVYVHVPLLPIQGTNGYYGWTNELRFHDFPNATTRGFEEWTARIRANDSFDNNQTSDPYKFKLIPWPLHAADEDYMVVLPATHPNASQQWNGPEPYVRWTIRVEPNMTGFYGGTPAMLDNGEVYPNQQLYNLNMEINVTTPDGRTHFFGGGNFTPRTVETCYTNTSSTTTVVAGVPVGGETPACGVAPGEIEVNNTFEFNALPSSGGPGPWNWSITVRDVANYTKVINGTIRLVDNPPAFEWWNKSVDTLTPGANVTLAVNVSDDNNQVERVHVNFTRISGPSDGAFVNLTLGNLTEVAFDGRTYFNYTDTFETGRGKVLGLGGTFNVTLAALDLAGGWSTETIGTLNITDEDAPQIIAYGAEPSIAQLEENVTFWARAQDTTNVTLRLEIFKADSTSELLMDPIVLEEGADGNFTFTTNFTEQGIYAWRLSLEDSVKHPGQPVSGSLAIRTNVGPRFDVRGPATVIDGTRYGSGTPRIEVVIHDIEGVDPASIELRIAGQVADTWVSPAPGNLNGYLVMHNVTAARKFSHNDVVEVALTAVDTSEEALQSWLNFTFKVDDVAPIARLVSVSPSYRDQPGHVLNVSLASRFTLAAEDNDGLPTDVTSIRYRIVTASSAETVYTSPFTIDSAPGVYTGPKIYTIQFWAEDSVGNVDRTGNTTPVFVDDSPPALFQFFPQGRHINATFVDDRVGVDRSVVWYRLNSDPYVPLPLVETDGAWTITLPEGVKGDRISYYLQAWDRLDNTETFGNASAPYASFNVDNHQPNVRITAPVDGSRVSRSVDLTWEASDEDGDALVFTVYVKAPGQATFRELAKIENSATRRYTIDTARFADGQYTFRLAAGDGGFVKLAETTVTILNRASAVGVVNVIGNALPGETLLIKAEITKAEAIVEARLYLDGKLVDSYPMNDEGREGDEAANDGFYSVRVTVLAAGDYSVEIFTQYREDGELKESSVSGAATFSAKLTPGYIFTKYGAIIALIGLLGAVGIGVAVFVVMRRR